MPELIYENDGSDECRFVLGKFGERNLICVGLNPSRAEPGNYDPTMKRVENWASMHGYDGHIMVNLYPQRATKPSLMDDSSSFNELMVQRNLECVSRPDERDRPAPCRRGGARGLRRRCGRAPLREARHHRLVAGAGPKRRDLRGRQPPGAGAVARRGFRRSATFRPTAPRGGATSTSPSGSLRHLAAPRSSSGAPNPRLLNPHRLHVDLPRNRFDRQSFTCDVVKLEYTYPQQVHRRNALTRTVGTNPSSESRRMLRAGGGRPERHLRAVRLERDGTQRTTSACSRGK